MRSVIISLACFLFISCVYGATLNKNWRLTWSDEFNTLDRTKWNLRDRPGNYGNGEKQWYHPNQTTVSNGKLVITATKKSWGGMDYLSGKVDSMDKAYFTYGRYEVRARFSAGKGLWPAIWLLSQTKCWALGAEADIAEFRSSYKTKIGTYYHYANQCCYSFGNCISSKGTEHDVGVDLTAGYHVYALEWFPENMTWYVDDVKVEQYKTNTLSYTQDKSPHYWILNNAVGGGYPGNPDSTTPFPNYFYIDYVRNYVWRPSCSGTNVCSGHGCCDTRDMLCKCDDGWAGASCEFDVGTSVHQLDDITSNDIIPNGWGNGFSTYLTANSVRSSGTIALSISNSGCPANCGATPYSAGGYESLQKYTYGTFSIEARPTKVSGTALSMGAAADNSTLNQIAFTILGNATSKVNIFSWTNNYQYLHTTIETGIDLSLAYHTYSFVYAPASMTFSIDGVVKYTTTEVVPTGNLGFGVYYSANPQWYGPFSYTGVTTAYVAKTSWTMTRTNKGKC